MQFVIHLLVPAWAAEHRTPIGGTATQNIWVTLVLAVLSPILFNLAAIKRLGLGGYFAHMTGGAPILVVPMIFELELLGQIVIKPVALAIRLFANMTAGHILLATLMGFESGSGNADAAMQAKMLGTEMVRRNYAAPFAAAIVAASAVITPIIPPGLGFVIYGYLANVSVGRLFLAGDAAHIVPFWRLWQKHPHWFLQLLNPINSVPIGQQKRSQGWISPGFRKTHPWRKPSLK